MILFVFEGHRREKELFLTMEQLFFPNEKNRIIACYDCNIHALYNSMTDGGKNKDKLFNLSLLSVLKQKNILDLNISEDEISEIYLFFDYDLQDKLSRGVQKMDELNQRLIKLINFFNDETENGKLYINYPCIEAIRYTKELPDSNYHEYVIELPKLASFKQESASFSFYKNFNFISYRFKNFIITNLIAEKNRELQENWNHVITQNIEKASFICTGTKRIPTYKEDISQDKILSKQITDFFPDYSIILCSFPLFLYEYFPKEKILAMIPNDTKEEINITLE